jgi:transforming growth factor-beta-induced protein
MRKLVVLLVIALLAVVPVMAQDAEPTIAEIVVSSTEAETPEFSVLLAAVSAADPVFLEELSDPAEAYTVFAPTDAAFTALLEQLGVTAEDLLADTALLNEVLSYHVVPGEFVAEEVVALNGSYLGTILPGEALMIMVEGETVMVNASNVVTADVQASNGVVHVIDAVLVPAADEEMAEGDMMATEEAMATEEMMATEEAMATEEMMEEAGTIADIVVGSTTAETPEFTVLLAAVQAADPSVLAILSGTSGPFTVFAPTDAAFAALLEELGVTAEELLANTELLNTVLSYHVVPGEFYAADFVGFLGEEEGVSFATLANAPVTFNGTAINASNLVTTDIAASNGVVHVIDAVLVPAAGE